jgi:serine/threonine protein phosphatase PrpC
VKTAEHQVEASVEPAQTEPRPSATIGPTPSFTTAEPSAPRLHRIVINHEHHEPAGTGEDALPIETFRAPANGLIGVFDGLGGAGGETVKFVDGTEHTGAWLASRRARNIVLDVYDQLIGRMRSAQSTGGSGDLYGRKVDLPEIRPPFDFTHELKRALQEDLTRYAAEIHAGGSGRLKSRLIKTLPTTMAICAYDLSSQEYTAIWAGDSRVYCLNPDVGLQQVTTDDLKTNADALENLTQDAIMSNCVSASADFVLRERRLALPPACVLIAATDGCFGYVQTPLHFEYILLSSMHDARSFSEWQESLEAGISKVTKDDSTMAAVAIGWPDFAAFQERFVDRYQWCAERVKALDAQRGIVDHLGTELSQAREQLATLTRDLWEEYRRTYEMPALALTRVVPKGQGGGPPAKSRQTHDDTEDNGEQS